MSRNDQQDPPDSTTPVQRDAESSETLISKSSSKEHQSLFKVNAVQWDNFLKRYVWDDETTPYFVSVSDLNRRQARSELFAYTLFLGFLFSVAAIITLSDSAPGGRSSGMSLFSFTIVCSAVLLSTTRHYWAAWACSAAAPGTLIWIYLFAKHPGLGAIDDAVIIIFALCWMYYGLRVVNITNAFEDMPEGADKKNRRRWGRRQR